MKKEDKIEADVRNYMSEIQAAIQGGKYNRAFEYLTTNWKSVPEPTRIMLVAASELPFDKNAVQDALLRLFDEFGQRNVINCLDEIKRIRERS